MFETSEFLKKHTKDLVWRLIARGWSYYTGDKCEACKSGESKTNPALCTCTEIDSIPEWTPELKTTIIEAFSRGLVVDTAFVVRWKTGRYMWFTRNDILNNYVYGTDKYRDIREVYLRYSRRNNLIHANPKSSYHSIIGFLTQHSGEEVSKPARFDVLTEVGEDKMADTIFQDCVVIQPSPNPRSMFGDPAFKIEVDTSSQKKSLRTIEFAFLHMGGAKRTIVVSEDSPDSVKDEAVRDIERGVHSKGLYLEGPLEAGVNVNEMVLVATDQMQNLNFKEVNDMVNEDAQLSKQKISGGAESGALGGMAPKINMLMDETQLDSLYLMFEQVIRDINDVFFGEPGYEESSMMVKGREVVNREPAYEIRFNDMVMASPDTDEGIAADNGAENTMLGKNQNSTMAQAENNATIIEAHSVAIAQQGYVSFEGNMLAPGTYKYDREQDKEVEYTAQEIQYLTEQPVKQHFIELNHSYDDLKVGLGDNIGYQEIQGFNQQTGKDITRFNIRDEFYEPFKKKGIIFTDNHGTEKIKVSPFFGRRYDPVLGHKVLYIKNTAVVDPNHFRPQAEVVGLDTSAKKVN